VGVLQLSDDRRYDDRELAKQAAGWTLSEEFQRATQLAQNQLGLGERKGAGYVVANLRFELLGTLEVVLQQTNRRFMDLARLHSPSAKSLNQATVGSGRP